VSVSSASRPSLRILGIRGIPAAHGGFETFAERLALYLHERGWNVTVYCQEDGPGSPFEDRWRGIRRVRIPTATKGPAGTMLFDWKSIRHAAQEPGLCLTLGYNTAVFSARLRAAGLSNVINMDGIEWRRAKWGQLAKAWLWMNERAGAWLGDRLVADHPDIARHLRGLVSADKITTIAYGADRLEHVDEGALRAFNLEPGKYLTLIARPEPENSVLEVVRGFSRRQRGLTLAVLGTYAPDHAYHRAVKAAAGSEVRFLGAIYDKPVLNALRFHAAAYVHGHQVGGTNPSLVEALGAGNAVLAHDNVFNRWVAGEAGWYFDGEKGFADTLDRMEREAMALPTLRSAARHRFSTAFEWPMILGEYQALLDRMVMASSQRR
jgi:glycosyltransferase involved in cell wall biosynthesis